MMDKRLVVISDCDESISVVAKVTEEQLKLLYWLYDTHVLVITTPMDSTDFVKEE